MSQTERREIRYLRCIINFGKLELTWSIITPSTWDWIGLYDNVSKSNRKWLDGHWFYISNHSNRSTLPDGRYVYSGNHCIETVSGMNQIRLNTYEVYGEYKTYSYTNVYNPVFMYFDINQINYIRRGLKHIFDRHKGDWGFTENDHWNIQSMEKLQRTLQEFIHRNINNVYSGTYKNQDVYFVLDSVPHNCVIIYRGGDEDYQLWSGWKLSDTQYNHVTQPPFKLHAVVLTVYEDILNEIANSEVERDDLLKLFLKVYLNDKNRYSNEVYNQIADFFGLAESYIPLSFEDRDEVQPEDNYELDFEKIKKKAKDILGHQP
ncbi:colicin d/e5 nuclease [Gigaspora margarita]|uniref:Colicin d/e5 nuclease n=1 Tax=Gigaspora margarita TaxID=4874 RepID=A0A8H4A5Q0_GIGMA|nr:colicin d/e5 nuclease [Gigaspora margarita]